MCYNRNCYKTFANAKGLSVHISKNAICREFVAHHNLMATINRSFISSNAATNHGTGTATTSCPATLNWYKTQSQRLNPYAHLLHAEYCGVLPRNEESGIGQLRTIQEPGMHPSTTGKATLQHSTPAGTTHKAIMSQDATNVSTTASRTGIDDHAGHASTMLGSAKRAHAMIEFTFSTPSSASTSDDDDVMATPFDNCDPNSNMMEARNGSSVDGDQRLIVDHRPSGLVLGQAIPIRDPSSAATDSVSQQAVFYAMMECARANQNATLQTLQYDVEHKCIVELVSLLESLQCPDYALEKILHWANDAHQQQFSFRPRAYTREANIQWMYKLLRNSHQHLPFIQTTELEDYTAPQQVVCFDFGFALLSLLQDATLMQLDNLALNTMDPLAMFQPANNRLG